jgi:hypothetical protein
MPRCPAFPPARGAPSDPRLPTIMPERPVHPAVQTDTDRAMRDYRVGDTQTFVRGSHPVALVEITERKSRYLPDGSATAPPYYRARKEVGLCWSITR